MCTTPGPYAGGCTPGIASLFESMLIMLRAMTLLMNLWLLLLIMRLIHPAGSSTDFHSTDAVVRSVLAFSPYIRISRPFRPLFPGSPPIYFGLGKGPITPPDPAMVRTDRKDLHSNKTKKM